MWPWLNDNMFDTDLCLYGPLRAVVNKSWRIMECVAVDEKFEMLRNEWFALCPLIRWDMVIENLLKCT